MDATVMRFQVCIFYCWSYRTGKITLFVEGFWTQQGLTFYLSSSACLGANCLTAWDLLPTRKNFIEFRIYNDNKRKLLLINKFVLTNIQKTRHFLTINNKLTENIPMKLFFILSTLKYKYIHRKKNQFLFWHKYLTFLKSDDIYLSTAI